MTSPVLTISIPFRPLLSRITELLKFEEPHYALYDKVHNVGSVTVKNDLEHEEYVFIGGSSSNFGGSCEQAARLAVTDLIEKFDIYIGDFTAATKQAYERCANLWRLKHEELKRKSKGFPKVPLVEEFVCHEMCHYQSLALDMVSILRVITNKIPIKCSSITTLEQTPSCFLSWLTINRDRIECGPTHIVGEIASSEVAAERNLAYKTIKYLIPIYNIDLIDANYAPEDVKLAALTCECARNHFENLQKRLSATQGIPLGIQTEFPGSVVLNEDECITPKSSPHTIPDQSYPPPPPKKQKTPPQLVDIRGCTSRTNKIVAYPRPVSKRSVFYKPSK